MLLFKSPIQEVSMRSVMNRLLQCALVGGGALILDRDTKTISPER